MSETPRTAEQLVNELETCAFDCGDYSNSVTASQARIAKHEAALRKAEKDVVERITTLERELAAMTARAERDSSTIRAHEVLAEDIKDSLKMAYANNAAFRIRNKEIEDDLHAITAERDALIQTCGELCPHCGWRGLRGDAGECAFCQNAKLSADLYNMTAAKQLAERQVDALCRVLVAAALLPDETSSGLQPVQVWRNWSRAEAEKGGKE